MARERFRREVRILSAAAVQHRSVVRLLDWDADAERPWYISKRGGPFIEWWRDLKDAQSHPFATTWLGGSVLGTHGGDASYIVSSLSQHLDQFLTEHLRVNEEACNGSESN